MAAVTVGVAVLTDDADGQPGQHTAAPSSPAEQARRIAERLAAEREKDLAEQRERETARRVEAAEALARALRAPGLRPTVHGASVEVAFTEGLFSEGAQLTPEGTDRLAALGERLAGREMKIEIYGHAATVPGAPRSGGSVTSLWRAGRGPGTRRCQRQTPHRVHHGQRDAPYGSAAQDRTVTVMITPD
ncbi:hypothetical protein [Streptomyces olindensis]|uniref:hypothetical protein n=1 Tax=Streptomyces olindensis TaxID=358823 RepID=UPI0033EB0056